jgi:DNA repair exonuclease SbcCD ATPase subunit
MLKPYCIYIILRLHFVNISLHFRGGYYMANTNPFSVRMDEEDKSELIKLIQESGKGAKEFMSVLINSYKLTKTQNEVPEMSEDIKHLQAITSQICDIYINIGTRIKTIEETNLMQYNKDLSIYREKITALESNLAQLEIEKSNLLDLISKNTDELERLNTQIITSNNIVEDKNKLIRDKDSLIEEYKEKNDNLLSMISDLKEYKDKIDTISSLLADSQTKNANLENTIAKLNNDHELYVSKLQLEHDKVVTNLNNEIQNFKETLSQSDVLHKKSLEDLRNTLEFQKEKALLEQEKKFNKIINDLHNDYTKKIAIIQEQANKQILSYQKEIDNLLKATNVQKNKSSKKTEIDSSY